MKIECHILCFNEAEILPYTLGHYLTFCDTIIVHDAGSDDGSVEICRKAGVSVVRWACHEKFNDIDHRELKNHCWHGTDSDWVIIVDCDEIVYFPKGWKETLETYSRLGAAIIKPHGFEMFSEKYPTTELQIYDEVKMGARDDKWYSKPVLFSPHKVEETGFGIGAHESQPVLKNGRRLHIGKDWPKANPPCYLLHFHHGIGPIERLARRLDEKTARLSPENLRHGWGNQKPGMVHATEKLDFIKAGLMQVIA